MTETLPQVSDAMPLLGICTKTKHEIIASRLYNTYYLLYNWHSILQPSDHNVITVTTNYYTNILATIFKHALFCNYFPAELCDITNITF